MMKSAAVFAIASIGIAVCAPAFAEEQKKPPVSQRFILVCSAQLLMKNIAVDIPGRTVNGHPAKFSETTITWKTGGVEAGRKKVEQQPESKKIVMHELNRLEGTYRSWGEGETAENSITYSCEKAPPQKF